MKKWKGLVSCMALCLIAVMVLPGVSRASALQIPARSVSELLADLNAPLPGPAARTKTQAAEDAGDDTETEPIVIIKDQLRYVLTEKTDESYSAQVSYDETLEGETLEVASSLADEENTYQVTEITRLEYQPVSDEEAEAPVIRRVHFADGICRLSRMPLLWYTSTLEEVDFPESIEYIEDGFLSTDNAFRTEPESCVIRRPEWLANMEADEDGIVYAGSVVLDNRGASGDGILVLEKDCTQITPYAFAMQTWITSVTLPDSVEEIGAFAFFGCTNMTGFTISEDSSLQTLGYAAFGYCEDRKEPGSYGAPIQSIVIPGRVLRRDEGDNHQDSDALTGLFSHCQTLQSVTFTQREEEDGDGIVPYHMFYGCTSLESVTLPENTGYIAYEAFAECTGLTGFSLPYRVTELAAHAFYGCASLSEFTIPDNSCLNKLAASAFGYDNYNMQMKNLTWEGTSNVGGWLPEVSKKGAPIESIRLPQAALRDQLLGGLFAGNTSLKSVEIQPDEQGNETPCVLGFQMFAGCTSLETVTLNGVVAQISTMAFYEDESLAQIDLTGVQSLGTWSFMKTGLTSLTLPSSLREIGTGGYGLQTFGYCESLETVDYEAGCTAPRFHAALFEHCSALTTVKIPDSILDIGFRCFNGCTSLKEVEATKNSRLYRIQYQAFGYGNKDMNETLGDPVTGYEGTDTIPCVPAPVQTVTLPANAFQNSGPALFAYSQTIKNVTLYPDQTGTKPSTTLEYQMFLHCKNLQEIKGLGNISNIGVAALDGCSGITSLDLDGVERIGVAAFYGTSIKELTLPASVKEAYTYAFGRCPNLKKITIQGEIQGYYGFSHTVANMLGIVNDDHGLILPENQKSDPVTSVAQWKERYPQETCVTEFVFEKTEGVSNSIETGTQFMNMCPTAERIVIGEGIESLAAQVFGFNYNLQEVELPESLQKIGDQAFISDDRINVDFSRLTNLKTIGEGAFQLKGAYGAMSSYDDIVPFDPNERIGGISEVVLPDGIESIGGGAFYGQRNVTRVVLPESLTTLKNASFQYMRSLQEISVHAAAAMENWDSVFWNESSPELVSIDFAPVVEGVSYSSSYFYDSMAESITLGGKLDVISRGMLMNCKQLHEIEIPDTVKTIERAAFMGTRNIRTIDIPASVQSMDIETFRNSGIKKVYIYNPDMIIKEPVTSSALEDESHTYVAYSGSIKSYAAIPSNVTIYGYVDSTAHAYAQAHGNRFIPLDGYNVTFHSNGGDDVATQAVEAGRRAQEPEEITRTNYNFTGWYTDEETTEKFDFGTEIQENTDLYAGWEKKEQFRVTFQTMGGSSVEDQDIYEGYTASVPEAPTREGYLFQGWYTSNTFHKVFDFTSGIKADTTVYALWEVDPAYVAPTTEPTLAPTSEPTNAPTTEPTLAPTSEPTNVPTTEPTLAPTSEPTTAPSADPTSSPEQIPAGPAPVPTSPAPAPGGEVTPAPAPVPTAITFTVKGLKYQVTDQTKAEVSVVGTTSKTVKKVTIPKTVKAQGVKYTVSEIGPKAFAKCKKLKKITIKTTKLKKVGKKAFTGIHKKAVIRVPKSRLKKYTRLLRKKGQPAGVRITG